MKTIFCLMLFWAAPMLVGCSSINGQLNWNNPSSQAHVKQRQILVNFTETQDKAPIPVGPPGTGYRIRHGHAKWRASPRVQSLKAEIEKEYNLRATDEWPIEILGVFCVVFEVPVERDLERLVENLAEDHRVESVERVLFFDSLAARRYNDPYLKLQYAIDSMEIENAHRLARGRGIRVGIIDTGVDVNHPDIHNRIRGSRNFVTERPNSSAAEIHGTAIAGVIASLANNDIGIIGVAPDVEILALKACWSKIPGGIEASCSSFTLALAISFAIEQRVDVLNLSLTGPPGSLMTRLIQAAMDRGTIVVAASPDFGPLGFPASLAGVIAVQSYSLSTLARHGIDAIMAPGELILTTTPHGHYDFLSGSSLAAAHVSGIVALLLERDSSLTSTDILKLLKNSPPHNQKSINAYNALSSLMNE